MNTVDWVVVGAFFLLMVGIGVWARKKSADSADFFVGGGKVPWWLSGVSHHVSGHSGVVFVAYAAIAYELGFTMYVWWALVITVAIIIGSRVFVAKWPLLRQRFGIQSPTEYLKARFGQPAQLTIAISGVLMKLLDIAAKWAAIGILLHGFTGVPVWAGVIISGLVSMVYITHRWPVGRPRHRLRAVRRPARRRYRDRHRGRWRVGGSRAHLLHDVG